jgi:predicted RNA-binding Zn-ribbon protein involved in translation (DUF1610 family)
MSLESITAAFACDKCGDKFTARIDPAKVVPFGWTAFEVAEDAAHWSSRTYEVTENTIARGGRHLCVKCGKQEMDADDNAGQ